MKDLTEEQYKHLEQEGQEFINKFKSKMKDACEEILGNVYCDLMPQIASDAWINYRNVLRNRFARENAKDEALSEWGTDLRKKIFQENKKEIIKMLNEDLVKRARILEERQAESWEKYF